MSKNQNQIQNSQCKNCQQSSSLTTPVTVQNYSANSEFETTDLYSDNNNLSMTLATSNSKQNITNNIGVDTAISFSNLNLASNYMSGNNNMTNCDNFVNNTAINQPSVCCLKNLQAQLPSGFDEPMNRSANNNSSIIERLSYLYMNELLADVHFLIKANEVNKKPDEQSQSSLNEEKTIVRVPAHKLILSIGSRVFMAMFYGSGSQMLVANEIEIPDVELEPFKNLLRYLYTDELCIEPDSVMSTLYAAKKYEVSTLEKECVDFLKTNLNYDNAFMLLQQSRLFDEFHLTELCLNLIDKNSCESFSSECFLDIDLDTLLLVLKRDTLGIREFKLYNYVLKWAENKCIKDNLLPITRENQQKVLGDAINQIRFSLMTKEEFATVMSEEKSRLIDDASIIDLFVNLTLNESTSLRSSNRLNHTPRCCLSGNEQVINRFSQVESRWGYSGTSDRVRFSVNRRIYLVGFGLYGSIYGRAEYQAVIQLIHYESSTICAQNTTCYTCDGTNATFRVLFKEPVELLSDTDYIASATLKGPDSFYGTKGMRKVNHEISMSTGCKLTFNFQYASGNNNGSSVEDGQIPELIFYYSCSKES